MKARVTLEEIRNQGEPLSNWSKFLVHPLSDRLLWLLVNFTRVHPTTLTVGSFVLVLAAAPCYALGSFEGLAIGAALFYAAFALDTIDGVMARLTNRTSRLGAWLDLLCDYVRSAALTIALGYGTYRQTATPTALLVALGLLAIVLLHYHLGEVSARLLGAQNRTILAREASGLAAALRRIGLVPNPLALNDLEALYLLGFPLAGQPLLGMEVALGLGCLSRLAVLVVNGRALRRLDRFP